MMMTTMTLDYNDRKLTEDLHWLLSDCKLLLSDHCLAVCHNVQGGPKNILQGLLCIYAVFDHNFRISWSIFIFFSPMETDINTIQPYVLYLLGSLMTS